MRIAFATFGCKINQYETEQMRQSVAGQGNAIVPFEGEADVYVINTCSVTAKSDYQCRQAIRAAVRRAPSSRVVVTGCYAETRPEEIRSIPGVSLVLGNRGKTDLVRHIPARNTGPVPEAAGSVSVARMRTRGFLKIQDGCDSRCSYCIVPHARGASRSIPSEQLIAEFDRMRDEGVPEVVLSGIHIGRYGQDLGNGYTLGGFAGELVARRGNTRIRLSSIEPREVTGEIIGMLGQGLCRHLHIPLQSGDDEVLQAMNRNYTAGLYRDLALSIAGKVPGIAIGADVMVGFPGETDRQFRSTLELIEELPLTHLHVFSYSPRPGTPAADMPGQVHESIKKIRNEAVRDVGFKKNIAFRRSIIGDHVEVLVEDKRHERGYSGLTDNYLRVIVEGAGSRHVGSLQQVYIYEYQEEGLVGTISDK